MARIIKSSREHALMTANMPSSALAPEAPALFNPVYLAIALSTLAIMIITITINNNWALNFMHVTSGVLWTGIDLFMGFVVGPVLRASPFEARRAVLIRLVPRTLYIMPTLSIITGTTGWFHAQGLGFMQLAAPASYWVDAALIIITLLTLQGLGILLPTNIRVLLELRHAEPDRARISALMGRYIYWVGLQGLMQIAMLVIMARFVTGL
jgi:hypothetical protein